MKGEWRGQGPQNLAGQGKMASIILVHSETLNIMSTAPRQVIVTSMLSGLYSKHAFSSLIPYLAAYHMSRDFLGNES